MKNKDLFIMIDDDPDDEEIFKMALSELKKPVDCIFFPDCESALAHFSTSTSPVMPPKYVFIDISLPRIKGDECLLRLQKMSEFDSPCIVVYSTTIPNEWKPRLERIGVDKFIEKTGSIRELVDKIQHLVNN